jgi:stage V sporulation protein R
VSVIVASRLEPQNAPIAASSIEARDTLANIQYIWARPVHLETVINDKPTLLSFDGTDHTQQTIGGTHESNRPSGTRRS